MGGKEELAKQRAAYQQLLQEYYKLDYEDAIGDLKCRFKYREVEADTFGMSVEDILFSDDKQLNAVVGMKKLAPYRDVAAKPNYKALKELTGGRNEGRQRAASAVPWTAAGRKLHESQKQRPEAAGRRGEGDTVSMAAKQTQALAAAVQAQGEGEEMGGGAGDGQQSKRAGKTKTKAAVVAAFARPDLDSK